MSAGGRSFRLYTVHHPRSFTSCKRTSLMVKYAIAASQLAAENILTCRHLPKSQDMFVASFRYAPQPSRKKSLDFCTNSDFRLKDKDMHISHFTSMFLATSHLYSWIYKLLTPHVVSTSLATTSSAMFRHLASKFHFLNNGLKVAKEKCANPLEKEDHFVARTPAEI
jgi:hypothetical protein